MNATMSVPLARLFDTLAIVRKEGEHLLYSQNRVFFHPMTADTVRRLEAEPELAERLEAFVSRFGRMQDTMADKLLPRWLAVLAEPIGSQIENLNRAERLGVLASSIEWMEARKLRNRLVHEYAASAAEFADDLQLASHFTPMLIETYTAMRNDLPKRLGIDEALLPPPLPLDIER